MAPGQPRPPAPSLLDLDRTLVASLMRPTSALAPTAADEKLRGKRVFRLHSKDLITLRLVGFAHKAHSIRWYLTTVPRSMLTANRSFRAIVCAGSSNFFSEN